MGTEVVADPVAEDLGPEELLEHAQHAAALLVGEHVEHALGLLGAPHRELDRPGCVQAVDRHGRFPLDAETDPALPLGTEGVDREHLHEGREGLVEPDPVPPAHGHQVPEPHVRDLVADDVRDPFELDPRRLVRIDQQHRLAEGHAPEVLHRTEREVGDGHQVELVGRVGKSEVVGEEAERVCADFERVVGQVPLAGRMHDPERHAPTSTGSVASSGPTTKATR